MERFLPVLQNTGGILWEITSHWGFLLAPHIVSYSSQEINMFYTPLKGWRNILIYLYLGFLKSHTLNYLNNKTKIETTKNRVSKLLTSQNKLGICVIANDSTDRGPERLSASRSKAAVYYTSHIHHNYFLLY